MNVVVCGPVMDDYSRFSYLNEHHLLETVQSCFKTCHSTVTALLKVFNGVPLATGSGHSFVLMLLDLTTAFDSEPSDPLFLSGELGVCTG